MDLNSYVYFDIECIVREDAKDRLLELVSRDVPERKPADLREIHGSDWTENVLKWDVASIVEYVHDGHLDEDSLTDLIAAETFQKKPRKGVLGPLKKELENATGSPELSKDHSMMVDAAQIVAIGWKVDEHINATEDIDFGLRSLAECSGLLTYCGWNIESYDMPIVQLECIRRGIKPPSVDYKYGDGMFDLFKKTKYWSGCRRLTDVACALGCEVDDPLKGGYEVADRYKDGDMESILGHVHADVQRLYHIAEAYKDIL